MEVAGKWYADFFGDGFYHRHFSQPDRFERAESEADFIVSALELPAGAAVLDLCCGEGRHAVALARRGFRVTGLDLSAYQLRVARRAAKEADVNVRWRRSDMRDIPWRGEFDAVICMFTSFGVLESDEEDRKVLRAIERALRPGGRLLLDVINREMLVRHWQPREWRRGAGGNLLLEERSMDLLGSRQRNRVTLIGANGERQEYEIDLRLYTLKELADRLSETGMEVQRAWGGFDGRDYGFDSIRMIVLAQKAP